jgi:3-deoxy-D-manno-octulosonic-acid transferase
VYLLYSVATLVGFLVVSPYFLYQAVRHRKYIGSLGQRLGYLPVSFNLDGDASIWVHAVSVGEVLTARPLVAALQASYPNLRVFLSTTTRTGRPAPVC